MTILTRRTALALFSVPLAAPHVARAQAKVLNIYSSRHYDTDEALYTGFTKQTGVTVNRIEAAAQPLLERLRSEGERSPADVLVMVDAGAIERAREQGLLRNHQSKRLTDAIPAHLRDPDGAWFGFSTRARIIVIAKDKVKPVDINTYEGLADPRWKGQLLMRSSNAIYNQSLTGSILAALGEERTEAWARGVVANLARSPRGGDTDQIKAVAAGEGTLAVANTYYVAKFARSEKAEDRELMAKIQVVFPNQNDRGTHVNVSAAGICAKSPNAAAAAEYLDYLSSPDAQRLFSHGNSEYPAVVGVSIPPEVAAFGTFKQDQLNARVFAQNNARALQIMDRAGWK